MTTTDVVSVSLLIVTATYAWLTYKILQSNEKLVSVSAAQVEGTLRPYVTVSVALPPGSLMFKLIVRNLGRTSADHLRLTLDRRFCQLADSKRDLRELAAFARPIQSFPPGAEMTFLLATSMQLFGKEANREMLPLELVVTAEYMGSSKEFTEVTTIDLASYENSSMPTDPFLSELEQITEKLGEIRDRLKK